GFNLGNVFQMKTASIVDGREQEKKTDLFTMNFRTSYNFRADSLGLSPMSTSLSANPKRNISVRMSARHDFYKYDTALNSRVNQLAAPRLTSFIFGTTLRLQSKKKKTDERKGDKRESSEEETTADIPDLFASDRPEDQYANFVNDEDRFSAEKMFSGADINWSANLSLDYNYISYTPQSTRKTFYLRLSNIQMKLTDHWTVNYQAQYDLVNREIVSQIFNFRRDLHCWELSFRWVPNGPYKEYFFKINIKSPELRDIKVEKHGGRSSYYSY
ncbi:hypothetical protein KAH55_14445, partial [bacterium]|nr:hypothetical protein [bacterium]